MICPPSGSNDDGSYFSFLVRLQPSSDPLQYRDDKGQRFAGTGDSLHTDISLAGGKASASLRRISDLDYTVLITHSPGYRTVLDRSGPLKSHSLDHLQATNVSDSCKYRGSRRELTSMVIAQA